MSSRSCETFSLRRRGELEITDVNKIYLDRGALKVQQLGRGFAWLDTGTHESLLEASQFVETIERRQGMKIGCLEEIALEQASGSSPRNCLAAGQSMKSDYGRYLVDLVSLELQAATGANV